MNSLSIDREIMDNTMMVDKAYPQLINLSSLAIVDTNMLDVVLSTGDTIVFNRLIIEYAVWHYYYTGLEPEAFEYIISTDLAFNNIEIPSLYVDVDSDDFIYPDAYNYLFGIITKIRGSLEKTIHVLCNDAPSVIIDWSSGYVAIIAAIKDDDTFY